MHYITADFIFDGYQFLPENSALVLNSEFQIMEIVSKDSLSDVQYYLGLLMPGMINTHCHLELSHLLGAIPEHTGLVDFLLQVPTLRQQYCQKDIQNAIRSAEQQMLQNGIVAVGDICNSIDSLEIKKNKHLHYHSFIECLGLAPSLAEKRFQQAFELQQSFNPFHTSSIVMHAPYSVSPDLSSLISRVAINSVSSIHNQECQAENDWFLYETGELQKLFDAFRQLSIATNESGKGSIHSYIHYLQSCRNLILVHNTFTCGNDIEFVHDQHPHVFWCLCPNANLYIENALPNVSLLRQIGCNITLGTDSLASNHQLSIYCEMQTIHAAFPEIPVSELLQWATLNGAQALNMQTNLGSFEVGKTPGIVQIENFTSINLLPRQPIIHRIDIS